MFRRPGPGNEPAPGSVEDVDPQGKWRNPWRFWRWRYNRRWLSGPWSPRWIGIHERAYSGFDLLLHRILAKVLDLLLLTVPTWMIVQHYEIDFRDLKLQISFLLLLTSYDWFFLFCTKGQTPGKIALGLRVVKRDGTRLTEREALLRALVFVVGTLCMMLGNLWAILDEQCRGWHDMAAGSVVVNDRYVRSR